MHLIALLSQDAQLVAALSTLAEPGFHLHALTGPASLSRVLAALEPLEFAGALLIGLPYQEQALAQVQRSSLGARDAGLVDTVMATPAGLVGEYLLGKALGQALRAAGWDARNARGVVLGQGPEARAVARELASSGVRHLTVLATERPGAERSLPPMPMGAEATALALREPRAAFYLEQADLLVRTDPALSLDEALLGPHLGVADLSPEPLSPLRRAAMRVGARTLSLRDVQAYQISGALGHILGAPVEVERFLSAFHQDVR